MPMNWIFLNSEFAMIKISKYICRTYIHANFTRKSRKRDNVLGTHAYLGTALEKDLSKIRYLI
jgi:hypothetical protein